MNARGVALKARHFRSVAAFRNWLARRHALATELWVGFYKAACGRGGLTYKEAVDQALCYGWIDGLRKRVDESRYAQRFTPRTASSRWSQVNIRRVAELTTLGQMAEPGRRVFEARVGRTTRYSYEQRPAAFPPAQQRAFRARTRAWAFYRAQAPWYQRTARHWVLSAKKEETRRRRFATLLDDCAAGRRLRSVLN